MMKIFTVLISLIFLSACNETFQHEFDSFQQLEKSLLIQQGWVPNWIPRNISKIYTSHNIDTDSWMIKFTFDKIEDLDLPKNCKNLAVNEIPKVPFNVSWVPLDVPPKFTTSRYVFMRCNNVVVAYSHNSHECLIWG